MHIRRAYEVLVVATLLIGGCGDDEITDSEIDDHTAIESFDVDALETDTIEVVDGLSIALPGEGMAVTMEVIYADGNTELITASVDELGTVALAHHNDFGFTPASEAGCASKCSDGSYTTLGYKWTSKYRWRYRDSQRPSSVGQTAAIDAFKHAFAGIQNSRNPCSLTDQVSATHEYLGTTSTAPNISSTGCLQPDGNNVIGWGDLPSGVLGLTCTWSSGGKAVESDQRYNRAISWFAGNSPPSGCSNRHSLRAVATHEAGHSFGLGHSGCSQTMAPKVTPCKSSSRQFGRGDVLGLRALY